MLCLEDMKRGRDIASIQNCRNLLRKNVERFCMDVKTYEERNIASIQKCRNLLRKNVERFCMDVKT